MIPPFSIFDVWICMFDAMKLANLHAERVDNYLPDERDPDLINLEEMRALRRTQFEDVLDTEYQKAS